MLLGPFCRCCSLVPEWVESVLPMTVIDHPENVLEIHKVQQDCDLHPIEFRLFMRICSCLPGDRRLMEGDSNTFIPRFPRHDRDIFFTCHHDRVPDSRAAKFKRPHAKPFEEGVNQIRTGLSVICQVTTDLGAARFML